MGSVVSDTSLTVTGDRRKPNGFFKDMRLHGFRHAWRKRFGFAIGAHRVTGKTLRHDHDDATRREILAIAVASEQPMYAGWVVEAMRARGVALEDALATLLVASRDHTRERTIALLAEVLRILEPVDHDGLLGWNDPHGLFLIGEHFRGRAESLQSKDQAGLEKDRSLALKYLDRARARLERGDAPQLSYASDSPYRQPASHPLLDAVALAGAYEAAMYLTWQPPVTPSHSSSGSSE